MVSLPALARDAPTYWECPPPQLVPVSQIKCNAFDPQSKKFYFPAIHKII